MATLSSFYGPKLARPYVLLDNEGNAIKDARVDPPRVQDALLGEARRSSAKAAVGGSVAGLQRGAPCRAAGAIARAATYPAPGSPSLDAEWAVKAPVKMGGSLVKPEWRPDEEEENGSGGAVAAALLQAEAAAAPGADFQLFFAERLDDVLADNPALIDSADRRVLLSAASVYWRERLSGEERAAYRARAAEGRARAAAQVAEVGRLEPETRAGGSWRGDRWIGGTGGRDGGTLPPCLAARLPAPLPPCRRRPPTPASRHSARSWRSTRLPCRPRWRPPRRAPARCGACSAA